MSEITATENKAAPAINMNELLTFAINNKASDIHMSSGMPPVLRINGQMKQLNTPPLQAEDMKNVLYGVMKDNTKKQFEENYECDFAYEIPNLARFRVNMFTQDRGIAAVFRTIPTKVLTLEELGTPEIFKEIISVARGLVLVTGPTGSGKSTTLAAMVDYINAHKSEHILTIEDPIEFVHHSQKSLINQREVGAHTHAFANALKSALREDPDVILIGELRDLETMRLALTAAETGHVVFATLHTSSAPKTIDRIIDAFPGAEKDMVRSMLSESLRAVISQTLVRTRDGKGRAAAHEIMIANPAIRNLIRENKIAQMYSVIQTGQSVGMCTLDMSLINLVKAGTISKDEALTKAQNKAAFDAV